MKHDKDAYSSFRWTWTSAAKRKQLMDETQRILSIWPETRALLDLAAAEKVPIAFADNLIGTDTDGVNIVNRTTGERRIDIKPYKKPEDCAIALIHELRHLWQDKQLGLTALTRGLGEKDATTAMLLNRVKEADAFAFTDLMIGRINHFPDDFKKMESVRAALLFLNRRQPLSEEQENEVSDVMAKAITERLPAERAALKKKFTEALTWLDSYDREAVSTYHRRYIQDPIDHMTEKQGHVVALADIRRLCMAGDGPTQISYMDDVDDKAFAALVMKDVATPLADVTGLMDAFEKAGTRHVKQKSEIDARLKAALKP
ncbi:MAG: DUF6782 family putative metallopeptidase [Alphaproteobacteria bacterium]